MSVRRPAPGAKARLMASTADHGRVFLASKLAAGRRIGTLDVVWTRLMLGKRAELDGDKLRKRR